MNATPAKPDWSALCDALQQATGLQPRRTTHVTPWSVRVDRMRRKAQADAQAILGTERKVRLDKSTCFCGTVKSCTVEVREEPGVRAQAVYTITLVGPTGHEMTYQTFGR